MKKNITIIMLIANLVSLFSQNDKFKLTEEKVIIEYFNEFDYMSSKYVTTDFVYSSGFDFISSISEVTILINGREFTGEYISLSNVSEGSYYIEIKKAGYKSFNQWVDLKDGTRIVFNFTLEREYGILKIDSHILKMKIYLDNNEVRNMDTIPTGSYTLKVKSFGYSTITKEIYIDTGLNIVDSLNFTKAEFNIEKISLRKTVFNPYATDGFKDNILLISVNGPGEVLIEINNDISTIYSEKFLINDWNYFVNVGQKINSLKFVENGDYIIKVSSGNSSTEKNFKVDDNLFLYNIPVVNSSSGLLNAATAEVNSISIIQTNFSSSYNINNFDFFLPFSISATLNSHFQFHTGFNYRLNKIKDENSMELFCGVLFANSINNLKYGLNIEYRFNTNFINNSNMIENLIGLNIPITLSLANHNFTITPQYFITDGLKSYFNTGIGYHYITQKTRLGYSGGFTTEDFKNISYIHSLEFYRIIPETQSFLGLSLSFNNFNYLIIGLNYTTLI